MSSLNRFFWNTFSSFEESIISQLNFTNLTLVDATKNYIIELVGTAEALFGKNSISSVILFGSMGNRDESVRYPLSDVDLLLIIKNEYEVSISKKIIIDKVLNAVEIKYHLNSIPHNIIQKVLRVVEKSTGEFNSHFICLESEWEEGNFFKIFNTNPIFSRLIAPKKIVIDSMRAGGYLLFGNASLKPLYEKYPSRETFKSLIMNIFLYFGGLFVLLFGFKNLKYILESVKWSLHAYSYLIFRKHLSLHNIITKISRINDYMGAKNFINPKFLEQFQELRKGKIMKFNYSYFVFILKCLKNIIDLHIFIISHEK